MESRHVFVYCAGVFDFIHHGHIRYLEAAKKMGDVLVVGLLTDDGAARYKRRPLLNYQERWEMVRALRCVDYIVRQEDTDPTETLKILKNEHKWTFDIMCRGDDFQGVPPGTEFIEANGGKVTPYNQQKLRGAE